VSPTDAWNITSPRPFSSGLWLPPLSWLKVHGPLTDGGSADREHGLRFLLRRLLLLAGDRAFGLAKLLRQRLALGRELLLHRIHFGVTSFAQRVLHTRPELTLRLLSRCGQLRPGVPQ
jgi:hypothetical protein